MSYAYRPAPARPLGLRLHLNENTAGCSPAVLEALRSLGQHDAAFYPDYAPAIDATARRFGVRSDYFILTNGLDDGIFCCAVTAFRAGGPELESIVVTPAFEMYAACADAAGGRVIEVPAGERLAFPAEAILRAINDRTRIIWLTTPNNPSGEEIPRDTILRLARGAPQALLFVDEAYADFTDATLLDAAILDAHPNLIVGRTFAKAYGLAAIRAGAIFGSPATLEPLRRTVQPYTLNVCAAVAIPAAIADTAHYDWYRAQVRESKSLLYEFLDRRRLEYWQSSANFVLARVPEPKRVVRQLADRGIYVRDRSADTGCGDCIRMTAGVVDDTRALLQALEDIL